MRFTIQAKLVLIVLYAALGMVVIAGVGWVVSNLIAATTRTLTTRHLPAEEYVYSIEVNVLEIGEQALTVLTATDVFAVERSAQRINEFSAQITNELLPGLRSIEKNVASWFETEHIEGAFLAYKEAVDVLVLQARLGTAAGRSRATDVNNNIIPVLKSQIKSSINEKIITIKTSSHGLQASAVAQRTFATVALIAVTILFLISALAVSFAVVIYIRKGLVKVSEIANRIAAGDLSARAIDIPNDEIGDLSHSLNNMSETLEESISRVIDGNNSVTVVANEIAAGNKNLSVRTERQAASLEETASSMEEMASTISLTKENSEKANDLSATARESVRQGVGTASQSVAQMQAIRESSMRISDVSKIIESIAFQTNILALNAAVEAARAGEQGRGFAVVAAEIRTLAQNTSASVKEIDSLVSSAIEKIEEGVDGVHALESALQEIDRHTTQVAEIISHISETAREQDDGIQQVNKAVADMDGVTQQNAALVEETAASSRSLADQTAEVNELLKFFHIQKALAE